MTNALWLAATHGYEDLYHAAQGISEKRSEEIRCHRSLKSCCRRGTPQKEARAATRADLVIGHKKSPRRKVGRPRRRFQGQVCILLFLQSIHGERSESDTAALGLQPSHWRGFDGRIDEDRKIFFSSRQSELFASRHCAASGQNCIRFRSFLSQYASEIYVGGVPGRPKADGERQRQDYCRDAPERHRIQRLDAKQKGANH